MTAPASKPLQVARSVGELHGMRATFTGQTVALVPTMGALHDGHRSLIRLAARHADRVVVSIFVNPLQFGPGEDYARYPRVIDNDLDACAAEGVDLVFVPSVTDLYPPGRQVQVNAGPMGAVLEGVARPGHFDGVLTVVLKLFNLVRPEVAVFGEKDAQQLACIRRMVADLDVSVQVVGGPVVREPDGLALSSRNRYLSTPERRAALTLSASLWAGAGHTGRADVLGAARRKLSEIEATDAAFRLDYLELVHPMTFLPVGEDFVGEAILAVAAEVGTTRLIDNVMVRLRTPDLGNGHSDHQVSSGARQSS